MKQRKGKLIGQVVGISCIAAAVGCIILSIIGMKEVKESKNFSIKENIVGTDFFSESKIH